MDNFKPKVGKVIQIALAVLLALSLGLAPGANLEVAQGLPPIPPVATFTVTALAPISDLPVGMYLVNGVCPDPGSPIGPVCTLREAVDEANAAAAVLVPPAYIMVNFVAPVPTDIFYGPVVIQSNVVVMGFAGGGPMITIPPYWMTPPPPLPPVVIPPPFDIFQMVGNDSEVYGTFIQSQGFNEDAVQITGNRNLVDQNVLIGNNPAGVHVIGPSPANGLANTITGNLIGIDSMDNCLGNQFGILVESGASTTTINHNRISCNTNDGILLDSTLGTVQLTNIDTNTIGLDSTDAIAKPNGQNGINDIKAIASIINMNIISGNLADGIRLTGSEGSLVTRNIIGLDGTATVAVPNGNDGILIEDADDDAGANNNINVVVTNIISGNGAHGVEVTGEFMDHVSIAGNTIGLDLAGTGGVPNIKSGVYIHETGYVTVGGADPTLHRNLISANGASGVEITDAAHVLVDANTIGLDVTGVTLRPNSKHGVSISGAGSTDVVIGSLPPYVAIPFQFISGNLLNGITIDGSAGVIVGPETFIGVAMDGITPMGNGGYGVLFHNVSGARMHARVVAYNGTPGASAGIAVTGTSSAVEIRPMTVSATDLLDIFSNGGLSIDLADDGHTPNDVGDGDSGPNALLNYPEVTSLVGTTITGSVCNNCEVLVFENVGNPAGPGGGGLFRYSVTASGTTWYAGVIPGSSLAKMTFVAYDPTSGDTSEMSPRYLLYLPVVIRP